MDEAIVREILTECKTEGEDTVWLRRALTAVEEAASQEGIAIERTRWLAIGVHLAAAVRRARTGEHLPKIEDEILSELREDLLGLSGEILGGLSDAGGTLRDAAEKILLAVHLQCAQDGF